MASDWDQSAQAWIDVQGEDGDWGRRRVLDAPTLARATGRGFRDALDVDCGEGRFFRMFAPRGLRCTGIDPTAALIECARALDPGGGYRMARVEALPFDAGDFDLVLAYLALVDVPELPPAIAEAHRVLRPGGSFPIANLQSFNAACPGQGWTREPDRTRRYCIDRHLEPHEVWVAWRGVRFRNHHRPLEAYRQGLLDAGLSLVHIAEPAPQGAADDKADRYRRAPNFLLTEWRKAG